MRFAQNQFPRENDDGAGDARRECASVTARCRACVPRVVKRVLGTGVRTWRSAPSHARERSNTHPPTSPCRGGECAYVRAKSGPPIDSEQLRAGPDRPVSPFTPLLPPTPPRRPPTPRVATLFPRVCVLCVCIRRMNALLRGGRSCHDGVPFLLFRDIPLSIFYQTAYLDIRLSICRSGCSVSLCFTWITISR